MKQAFPPGAPPFDWRRQRTRWGVEYLFYPDALAREQFLYPIALGRSKIPPDNVFDHIVKDYYLMNYDEPYSLKEMCAAIHVSRSHFTRRFHKETGVPPITWLTRYRIEQAERLLCSTDKTISEVAAAVGIPDANYFSRKFRVITGCSPRDFWKNR